MFRSLIFIPALVTASIAAAAQPAIPVAPVAAAAAPEGAPDPRFALLKLLPAGSKIDDLRPSPIAGIYEFSQGAEVSYLTADGRFFLDGNMYDMRSRENLTEQVR